MDTVNTTTSQSTSSFLRQYQLSIFFSLSLAFSVGVAAFAMTLGDENIAILTIFSPTLAAIAMTALLSGKAGLRELLVKQTRQGVSLQWLVIAMILFPLVATFSIWLHSLFGGAPLALRTTALLPQMIVILLIGIGEEYGWRGYALPKLQEKYSALAASLILGFFWGLWHFPGYLIGTGVPLDMPFYVFMLWVVGATMLITWVYNNTRSVIAAVLMHMSANVAFNYLSLLPEFTGQMTTFWLFLGLVWVASAAVLIIFGPATLMRHSNAS